MKEELDKTLCEKYPKIFKNRHSDMRETAMCWGFGCGDGWYNLIDNLCFSIQSHIDWHERQRELAVNEGRVPTVPYVPQVVASQVKEKYGTLRFYYMGGDEVIEGIVGLAESLSAVTCEVCGTPGKTQGRFWLKTTCDAHSHQSLFPEKSDGNHSS